MADKYINLVEQDILEEIELAFDQKLDQQNQSPIQSIPQSLQALNPDFEIHIPEDWEPFEEEEEDLFTKKSKQI